MELHLIHGFNFALHYAQSCNKLKLKKRGKGRGTKWILRHFADKRENLRKPEI
jgi:hypothetical protein